MIRHGRDLRGDVTLEADVVVVGTGAGGGMVIRELARAGLDVLAFEEGEHLTKDDFTQREDEMLPLLYQEGGARATDDFAISVLAGRGVGGSTVHNTNLCKRTPPEILDLWRDRYAVAGSTPRELAPVFTEVERDLSVSEIPEGQQNGNNRALARGVKALGLRGGPLSHNRVGCRESGFCELGCAYDAKQNVTRVLLPQAFAAAGRATVLSDTRVVQVEHALGRVRSVRAIATDGSRPVARISARARAVVLSAGAAGSAALALVSGLPDPHRQAGRGLHLHPGAAIAGVFADKLDAFYGIPQSYECTEYLDFRPGSERRVWITTVFAHPIGAAAMMPGFGAEHMTLMRSYRHLGVLTVMVHDESEGRVGVDSDGAPTLAYSLNDGDRAQLALGLRAAAKILLAAGADHVLVLSTPPRVLRTSAEVDWISAELARPHQMPLVSVHPLGTLRMGEDARRAVVKSTGEHHHVRGLFVLDGSIFPTSLGVPPQISIYAFAKHLARFVVDRARESP